MSDLLRSLGIPDPFALRRIESHSRARPCRHRQRALAREPGSGTRARRAHSLHVDGGAASRRVPEGPVAAGCCRNARQDHDHQHACVDLPGGSAPKSRARAIVSDRRSSGKFRNQLPIARHAELSSSRATNTTPSSSTRGRSSSTTFPTRSFSRTSNSTTPTFTPISMPSSAPSSSSSILSRAAASSWPSTAAKT